MTTETRKTLIANDVTPGRFKDIVRQTFTGREDPTAGVHDCAFTGDMPDCRAICRALRRRGITWGWQ
jgi:hypothetical protein